MKLLFNAGSYKVILPKQLVEKVLMWKDGDELEIVCGLSGVKITKKKEV